MRPTNRLQTILLTLFVAFVGATAGLEPAAAQESAVAPATPAWLLLEQGKQAYREGDFGGALDLFRKSVAAGGDFPEADMWIGRVFEEEGEVQLAVQQYNKALAQKRQFLVPDDALSVQYSLANIYFNANQYGDYEVVLRAIVQEDSYYSSADREAMRDAFLRILDSGGFDRLLALYRFHDQRTLQAHSELGIFMYRTGRYHDAVLNLAFATITIFSTAIEEVERTNPDFRFAGTRDLMTQAVKEPVLKEYFDNVQLYCDLYYLAAALFAEGQRQRSSEIWRLVVDFAPAGNMWIQRSLSQLRRPTIEPILDVGL